ncbi:MAG TPA: META domain-containing protein, partial [Candidatus Saccharimonadia bacterium]|nr:META domain-containing protein [Candidatus Saccharimonadia bacterium]
ADLLSSRRAAAHPDPQPGVSTRMKRRSLVVLVALTVAVAAAACSSSSSSPSAAASSLVGTWQWTASTEAVPASQSVVPDPQNYTITFAADGTYTGKADCNQIAGTYKVDGSNLTITPGQSTLAFCGDASLDTLYVAGLGKVATYAIAGDQVTMTFADDAGTMTFTKA